jgi:hypothetical protein
VRRPHAGGRPANEEVPKELGGCGGGGVVDGGLSLLLNFAISVRSPTSSAETPMHFRQPNY